LIGPSICEETGINWLSIRHSCPEEYMLNSLVLKRLLESIYIDSWLLRSPQSTWKPYYNFAVRLEYGLPEISGILNSENLLKRFRVSEKLCSELNEIVKYGSSKRIEHLKNKVLDLSHNVKQVIS
jgi:hypothetical protein